MVLMISVVWVSNIFSNSYDVVSRSWGTQDMIIKRLLSIISLMATLGLISPNATAVLIDLDRNVPGDSELLFDTSTGFLWLDLSVTLGESYNQVITQMQAGGTYENYRYATRDEVLYLWSQANISDTNYTWVTNGEWANVKAYADRLGTSMLFDPHGLGTHALGTVEGVQLQTNERRSMETSYHSNGVEVRTSSNFYIVDVDFASIHNSSYLIRILPIVAGDIAPLGAPDGNLNAADVYVMMRIVLGLIEPDTNTLAYGDIYPVGAPDGVINLSDLLQLYKLLSGS